MPRRRGGHPSQARRGILDAYAGALGRLRCWRGCLRGSGQSFLLGSSKSFLRGRRCLLCDYRSLLRDYRGLLRGRRTAGAREQQDAGQQENRGEPLDKTPRRAHGIP